MRAVAHILMLLNQFSARGAAPDPPRQLADAFVAAGHRVTAIVIPWQQSQQALERDGEHDRLRVLRVPPIDAPALGRQGSRLARWMFSSWVARKHARAFVGRDRVDLIYTTSPAVSMAFLIRWALRTFAARSYLYVVDFFPFHQRAIGLIPSGPIFRFAAWQENALIRMFDVVGCMSPRGVAYLRTHYTLRPEQQVEVLSLSTAIRPDRAVDRAAIRRQHALPIDRVIAIFGGQITEGRGIEQIVEAARRARETAPDLHFVLAGSGRLVHLVEAYVAAGNTNLTLIAALDRDAYFDLAASCDIGLVVTVPIADIPTFPSKTLDYLQARLPVVAAVEPDTDFRPFVEQHGFGIVVAAGDAQALLDAVSTLARDPDMRHAMAAAGRRALHEVFDVNQAASRILAAGLATHDCPNGP